MRGIQRFLEGHQAYVRSWGRADAELLSALARGQTPDAIVVSCSDSRVIPEQITGAGPGALFVVRNVANLIPPFTSGNQSVGAALAYAIEHLRVSHLIVLGHYGCGGMAAVRSLYGEADSHLHADPILPAWLRYGRDSWDELVAAGAHAGPDWHERLVEENVLQQLANALDYPVVRTAVASGRLALHAWIYDLGSATLRFWDPSAERFTADASGGGTISARQVEEQDDV